MHKAMKKVLDEATFPLKSREVVAFIKVIEWFDELPKRYFNEKQNNEKKVKDANKLG